MPSFPITRRERRLSGTVNDTISASANVSKPNARAALAPSVAKPLPQYSLASRQPISTQGVKCASKRGTDRPIKPANGATPGISTAQRPKPCCSKCASMRAARALLPSRGSGAGKYSITWGSALSAPKGARSPGRHLRRYSRSVRNSAGRSMVPGQPWTLSRV